MWIFNPKKNIISHQALLLLALLGLSSCFEPGQQEEVHENVMRHTNENSNASFYLGKAITGESFDEMTIKGWSIPESKMYQLRACLSDRVTNERIIGHRFEVVGEKSGKVVTTDDQGCLNWKESLGLNFFAEDAKYLTLKREIKGVGIHKGSLSIALALNPWHSSRPSRSPEIIDLSKSGVPSSQTLDQQQTQQFFQSQFSDKQPVEVKNLSAAITSRRVLEDGHQVDIQLSFTPQVVFNDLLGDKVVHSLSRGEFDLYFEIVSSKASNDKSTGVFPITQRPIYASTTAKSDENGILFTDNKVDVHLKTKIKRRVPNGHYQLVVRLIPKGITTLGEFYAVYRFSEDRNLLSSRGSLRPIMTNLENPVAMKDFDQKLIQAKNDTLDDNDRDYQSQGPFQFDHMNIRFMRVLPNETTTKRSIAYRSEVCIRRSLDGRLVQQENFLIHKSDGSTETVNTQNQGCISWIDTISHHYYRPENIISKKVMLEHQGSGAKKELEAYLNPWDYGWTFAQDARKVSQDYIDDVNNRESLSSQLFISGFRYQTIRFRYEIDKFLNLNVKKTLLLDLSPKVLRYNSITRGRNATESLRDGVYLMKVAIQKDYYDPRTPGINLKKHKSIPGQIEVESPHNAEVEFISSVEKLIRVKHGRIITPVEFSVNDLRLMRIRSNFLIQIAAIDEKAMNITPDMSMSDIDLDALMSGTDQLDELTKTHPRRANSDESKAVGQYVLEDQYFSEGPYEVLDPQVTNSLREDNSLQSRFSTPDYDRFIDAEAGLPTRTFVGPIILLANSFSAGLRPTDDLEEQSDCEMLIGEARQQCLDDSANSHVPDFDNDPQVAKFYGSSRHLEDVSVTELIERQKEIELEYHNQQTYESLLSRYTKEFFLDYVSLTGEKLDTFPLKKEAMKIVGQDDEIVSFTDLAVNMCGSSNISDCLQPQSKAPKTTESELLEAMNFQTKKPWSNFVSRHKAPKFTKADLKEFVTTTEYDKFMIQRLCHTWVYHMMSQRLGKTVEQRNADFDGGWFSTKPEQIYRSAMFNCQRAGRDELEEVFHISQKLRPTGVEGYRFKGGKSMNFNVGSNFSMNFGESLSNSLDAGFDPLSLLKNLGGKIGSIFGVFSLKTGWGANQSRSLGQGTSVSSGTYLAMQKASMDLYFEAFEPCLEIRMQGEYLESDNSISRLIEMMGKEEGFRAASQGLFVCTGETLTRREPFNENYYYFTQHFTEGDMLDNGDLLNHPWLLALRGERNYAHFVNLIKATPATDLSGRDFSLKWLPNHLLKHYLNETDLVSGINEDVDLGERPLDQLIEAYTMMPPTFPGLFTPRPESLDYPK